MGILDNTTKKYKLAVETKELFISAAVLHKVAFCVTCLRYSVQVAEIFPFLPFSCNNKPFNF